MAADTIAGCAYEPFVCMTTFAFDFTVRTDQFKQDSVMIRRELVEGHTEQIIGCALVLKMTGRTGEISEATVQTGLLCALVGDVGVAVDTFFGRDQLKSHMTRIAIISKRSVVRKSTALQPALTHS